MSITTNNLPNSGDTITQLAKNPYSLALAATFVARHKPFAEFEFGRTLTSLMVQIETGNHLVLSKNDQISGYLGWLHTTPEIAEAWVKEGKSLKRVSGGNAVAVTVFATDNPTDTLTMIRAAKTFEPSVSVYWKRYYTDGRPPSARVVKKR